MTVERSRPWLLYVVVAVCGIFLFWQPLRDAALRLAGRGPTASTIVWQTDLDAALAEAAKTGKPVLIDFTASWCPPCREMERSTWNDDAVERAAGSFIAVKLDVDLSAARAPGSRYAVESIPTVLVVDDAGAVRRRGQFMNASEMVSFLESGSTTRP